MTDETKQPEAEAAAPEAQPVVAGMVVATDETGLTQAVVAAASGDEAMVASMVADDSGVLAQGAIGVKGEDAIVIASFADMDAAKGAYEALIAAEASGALDIEGVLVVSADYDGKIDIVKMTDHKTRNGFLAGAVAGAVIGLIFPPTLLAGAVWGGVGGAAIGKLRNLGARGAVAEELAKVMTPGSSGIIALARLAQVPQVEAALPSPTAVKSAPVSDEAAAAVKAAAKESGGAAEG